MNIYLIDDDKNIVNILSMIIKDRQIGVVIGSSSNGSDGLNEVRSLRPDIIVVDLLMPEMDGITFVKRAREVHPDAAYIMLSQVSSKDMVSMAYESGIDFYIQKPLNSIEVETVLRNVSESLNAKRTIQKLQSIIITDLPAPAAEPKETDKTYLTNLRTILSRLGIIGEKGSRDIITLIDYLISSGRDVGDETLTELCSKISDSPKTTEQRIRRTANLGMVNLANLGLEDYGNEYFMLYSNSLYNFEQVRHEMDFIRGKTNKHGNVKMKNFLHSLLIACTEM